MLQHVTDHVTGGAAQLLGHFKKPHIQALLSAWLTEVQRVEDMLWGLYVARMLDNAEGAMLDVLGKIVGQTRGGREDDAYRLWIGARVLVNRSAGKTEQVVGVVAKLVGEDVHLLPREEYPAAFTIEVVDPISAPDGVEIAKILQEARAIGVRGLLQWRRTSVSFSFSEDGTVETDSDYGFGAGEFDAVSDGRDMGFPDVEPHALDYFVVLF